MNRPNQSFTRTGSDAIACSGQWIARLCLVAIVYFFLASVSFAKKGLEGGRARSGIARTI